IILMKYLLIAVAILIVGFDYTFPGKIKHIALAPFLEKIPGHELLISRYYKGLGSIYSERRTGGGFGFLDPSYYVFDKVRGADSKTFTAIGGGYAKDKNGVYCRAKLMRADIDTFMPIERYGRYFFKDRENIWIPGCSSVLKKDQLGSQSFDVNTFEVLRCGLLRDKTGYYQYSPLHYAEFEKIELSNPNIDPNCVIKDGENLYYPWGSFGIGEPSRYMYHWTPIKALNFQKLPVAITGKNLRKKIDTSVYILKNEQELKDYLGVEAERLPKINFGEKYLLVVLASEQNSDQGYNLEVTQIIEEDESENLLIYFKESPPQGISQSSFVALIPKTEKKPLPSRGSLLRPVFSTF
ncbi:MAG: DKNYY domain-containing protein, partial [bacterium]|nr:DKNYY domain-containing protein [bacterium]